MLDASVASHAPHKRGDVCQWDGGLLNAAPSVRTAGLTAWCSVAQTGRDGTLRASGRYPLTSSTGFSSTELTTEEEQSFSVSTHSSSLHFTHTNKYRAHTNTEHTNTHLEHTHTCIQNTHIHTKSNTEQTHTNTDHTHTHMHEWYTHKHRTRTKIKNTHRQTHKYRTHTHK